MQNVNSTFKIVRNDYGTFTQETWKVHGYSLVRIIDTNAIGEGAEWRVRHDRELPDLDDMNMTGTSKVEYGVNWSAMGTKTPAEARDYAEKLAQAAEAAEAFTQIRMFI